MANLDERIEALVPEEALEAVNLLAGRILGATPDDEVAQLAARSAGADVAAVKEALASAPVADVAELARVALHIWAATEPEKVAAALDETGEKAFILEAVAIGILALGAISLYYTKGVKGRSERTTTVVRPDGAVEITSETKTEYVAVGELIGGILGKILGQGDQS
jgi:hypothetical protein